MNIGDRVRFAAEELERRAGDFGVSAEMRNIVKEHFEKKTVFTIMKVNRARHHISIDKGRWMWNDFWLIKVDNKPGRDARGRFIKKVAAEAPKVEEKKADPNINAETVRDEMNKRIGAGNAGVCTYGIQYEKDTHFQIRDVCHARLITNLITIGKPLYAALHMKGHFNEQKDEWKKYFRIFLHHALNESAFKNCFLTKNVAEAEEKGILLNMDEQNSRVVAAAIYIRSFTEYPKSITLFGKLVDAGVPIGAAWLISQGVDSALVYNGYNGGHHCIIGAMPMDVLIKGIVKGGELPDIKDAPFKEPKERYKVFKAISGENLYYEPAEHGKETLNDFMLKYGKPGGGFGGGSRNYTMFDLLKIAVKWCK